MDSRPRRLNISRSHSVQQDNLFKYKINNDSGDARKNSFVSNNKGEDFRKGSIEDNEELRRKVQFEWRRQVNKERISQLLEEQPELLNEGIDNSVLLRSKTYHNDFNFLTRNSHGTTESSP